MKKWLRGLIADESGATCNRVRIHRRRTALAIATAVQGVGTKLSSKFATISTSLK
jgi:pilus assembly protein Flp/PilA